MTMKNDNAYAPLFEKLRKNLDISSSSSNLSEKDAIKIRVKAISEIRERLEIVRTNKYQMFLTVLFPSFERILGMPPKDSDEKPRAPPTMLEDSNHTLRNVTLEVLNRLPNNERLKPYMERLLSICSHVLSVDNEENALIALRIIFDLHKNYRPDLDKKVQPFLDLVRKLYASVPETVKSVFGDGTSCFLTLAHSHNFTKTHNNSVHLKQHRDFVRFLDESHPDTVGDARVGFEYERQGEEEEEQRENTKTVDTVRILVQGSHGVSSYCDASVSALSSIYSGQHSRAHTSHDEHVETSVPQTSHGTQTSQEIL